MQWETFGLPEFRSNWSIGPLVRWSIGPLVECRMLNVIKVKLLSERTSGVPPVIFTNSEGSHLWRRQLGTETMLIKHSLPWYVQCKSLLASLHDVQCTSYLTLWWFDSFYTIGNLYLIETYINMAIALKFLPHFVSSVSCLNNQSLLSLEPIWNIRWAKSRKRTSREVWLRGWKALKKWNSILRQLQRGDPVGVFDWSVFCF